MEQNIRLDVNHMMADMLGGEYGVTQAQLAAMQDAAVKAQHAVEANRGTGWLGWMNLPYNQGEIVSEIEKVAEHVRKTFKYFVVLGIGGSALGPIAVHQALNHLHYNELPDSKRPGPKFYVEDNIDPGAHDRADGRDRAGQGLLLHHQQIGRNRRDDEPVPDRDRGAQGAGRRGLGEAYHRRDRPREGQLD